MEKKKKTIIIVSLIISVLLIVVGVVCLFLANNTDKGEQDVLQIEDDGVLKLGLLKDKIEETQKYKISFTLNDENYKVITKEGEQAKIEIGDSGAKKIYTIKDGSTFFKINNEEEEYEYKNNTSFLNEFENNLDIVLTKNYNIGTETIENKTYRYEEFPNTSAFIINFKGNIDQENTKTRFYFDGNDLKYIRTYIGDISQLLKISIDV